MFLFSIDLILKIRVFNWLLSSPNAAHRYAPFANGDIPISQIVVKYLFLLPEREYNKEELKIICIHELIHCKHKDILWKQLCGLVRVIHWWNPLVKQLDMDVDSWNETYCDLESTTIMKSKIIGFRNPQIIGTANPYTVLISTFLRTPTSSFH